MGYIANTGTSYTTLLDWQTATGWDANSISADPFFVSPSIPFDLHVDFPSPIDSAGTPIAEITIDFDGDPRDPVTPDIGADEFAAAQPETVDDLVITLSTTTDDSTNITLIWSPALNAQQYHIYKSSDPYTGFTLIGSTPDTTYTDTSAIISEIKSFYYITTDNQPTQTGISGSTISNRNRRMQIGQRTP